MNIKFSSNVDTSKISDNEANRLEMAQIKKWLTDNDYIINKHILGEYTDESPKWTEYVILRKEKLLRYNELENLIK